MQVLFLEVQLVLSLDLFDIFKSPFDVFTINGVLILDLFVWHLFVVILFNRLLLVLIVGGGELDTFAWPTYFLARCGSARPRHRLDAWLLLAVVALCVLLRSSSLTGCVRLCPLLLRILEPGVLAEPVLSLEDL